MKYYKLIVLLLIGLSSCSLKQELAVENTSVKRPYKKVYYRNKILYKTNPEEVKIAVKSTEQTEPGVENIPDPKGNEAGAASRQPESITPALSIKQSFRKKQNKDIYSSAEWRGANGKAESYETAAGLGFAFAIASIVLALFNLPLTPLISLFFGLAALILCLIGLKASRNRNLALLGIAMSLLLFAVYGTYLFLLL